MQEEILHLPSWAFSAMGKPIPLFQKRHAEGERPLLFIGGVHGDEPEGVRLARDLLHWIQSLAPTVIQVPWILIPDINPDGSQKNQRVNGRGVDLNRNFPSRDWSPEARAERYHPGVGPGSEPEVQALCTLIGQTSPRVIIHFHSWKPCVVYTGAKGAPWARLIAEAAGYEAREDIGYPTPGSLGQYAGMDLGIPVVCVEAEEGAALDSLWPRFGPGLQPLIRGEHP